MIAGGTLAMIHRKRVTLTVSDTRLVESITVKLGPTTLNANGEPSQPNPGQIHHWEWESMRALEFKLFRLYTDNEVSAPQRFHEGYCPSSPISLACRGWHTSTGSAHSKGNRNWSCFRNASIKGDEEQHVNGASSIRLNHVWCQRSQYDFRHLVTSLVIIRTE